MKFCLLNGYVKFATQKIEFDGEERVFYDVERKNKYISRLQEQEIQYTVTDYDEPSAELLQRLGGKKFNTVAEARAFIDGAYKPVEDRLNDIELALLESEGII